MRKDRLLKLADYLETVPQAQFDMTDWDVTTDPDYEGCGFAGCAVGWAAHGKLFDGFYLIDGVPHLDADGIGATKTTDWPAIQDLFGLTHAEGYELFSSGRYSARDMHDPVAVAERIRKFVKDHEREAAGA